MQTIGNHSLEPDTLQEAIQLAKKAKAIYIPVSGYDYAVRANKADFLALLHTFHKLPDAYFNFNTITKNIHL